MIPQEFRPGNWVTINGNPVKIYGVTVDGIILNKGAGVMPFEYFKPVPLTEELLLKAGFEKTHYPYNEFDEVGKTGFEKWGIKLAMCSITKTDYWFGYNGFKIHSFHHLQNLVYDLAGQELTLNL